MSGKRPSQRKQTVEDIKRVPLRLLVAVAIAVVLSLFAAWTMRAYSSALYSSQNQNVSEKSKPSIESLNASAPSKEYVYAGGRLIATEEPCVSDTQPPTFSNCPSINVAAAFGCPYATSAGVNYVTPVATDNCGIGAVVCNPPSGSSFNVGATTVTCTATDTSNNAATCSFVVNVFSACLVDDANPGNVVLFNAATGDYRFCCNGVPAASGRGTITVSGCNVTINHSKANRTVHISVSGGGQGSGASIQKGTTRTCQISDGNLTGNGCSCP